MKLADKTLELENDKFKIIEFDNERYEKNNRAHLYYKIQCKKCGEIFSRKKDCIHNFENLKCRNCIHNRFGKCLNALLYNVFTHYTNNAKQRNIDWNLSEEEFKHLITQPCIYCGEIPNVTKTSTYKNKSEKITGIDRIDPSKGYSMNNCVPCCKMCNIMKNKFSEEEFIDKVKSIYNNYIKSSTTISKESTLQANGSGNGELLTAA
ncbi:MAG: type II restriction endonuclease [Bacteriophage sp.]|jgi:hypothetical protein|nr:MAG: type II restriction endonuclease [Bacteriophage sp.]